MVSQIGDRFTQMAFIELLGKEFFGSFSAFGGVAVVFTLPSILLGPVSGPLIDSWRKKRVLLFGDAARAVLIAALPLVYLASGNLFWMFAVALVVYVFGFFFSSARLAFVPLIVGNEEFLQANAANLTILRVATGIGTLAGGLAVSWLGWRVGFLFDASTYVISFLLILFVKVDEKPLVLHAKDALTETGEALLSYLKKVGEGIRFMVGTKTMGFVMSSILALFFVSGVAFTVIVPTVQQTLEMGTLGVTLLAAAAAGGMFLGPLLTGLLGSAFNRKRLIIVSYLLLGCLFGLGIIWIHWIMMTVVVFMAGVLFSAINISQDTMIQERIPQEARGRLFAWREMLASLAFLATAIPAGFIAEKIPFQYVLVAVGGILVLFGLAWMLFVWNGKEEKEVTVGGQE